MGMDIVKRDVIFVLLDRYADWECAFIAAALNNGIGGERAMFSVKTLAVTKDPVISMGGFKTLPDYDINGLPEEYAALILVGGLSWFSQESKQIVALVKDTVDKKVLVGGICNASVFLGVHGFLNEVRHTSNTLEYLKECAGDGYIGDSNYVNKQAVSDQNIITANGTATLEFSKEILISLNAGTVEQIEENYTFNKFGFYRE